MTTVPAARRRLWPRSRSCPEGSSAAAAPPGASQAWRDGSHWSSRMSATRPRSASTSRAIASAAAAASAVAAYKKTTPAFPAVTETSSPARLRSRSQTESAKTGAPEASCPPAIRLTRHSSSTVPAYAKRMLQGPYHHALSACRHTELHDLCVVSREGNDQPGNRMTTLCPWYPVGSESGAFSFSSGAQLLGSADSAEGMAAFAQKRRPAWRSY